MASCTASRAARLFALLAILVLPRIAVAQYDQAVTYQLNAAHTGAMNSLGLRLPLEKKWTLDLGQVVSYPIIANGILHVFYRGRISAQRIALHLGQVYG